MRSISERLFKMKKKDIVIFGNSMGRPRKKVNLQEILQLKNTGKSNREIARIMKVSEATIRRRLREKAPSE